MAALVASPSGKSGYGDNAEAAFRSAAVRILADRLWLYESRKCSLKRIRTATRRLTVFYYYEVRDYGLYKVQPEHAHYVEAHPERPAG